MVGVDRRGRDGRKEEKLESRKVQISSLVVALKMQTESHLPSGGKNCGGVKRKHNLEVRGGESHLGRPWGVFFPRDGVILFHCQMSYYMGLCPYSDPEQKSLSGMQLPDYNFQILPFDVFELKRWKITVFHFIFFDFLYQPNMTPGGLDPCRVYVYKQRAFTDLYARNACRLKLNFRFCF